MKCAVLGCSNYFGKDLSISFHTFPKNKNLIKLWQDFCGQKADRNSRVCSDHFHAENFENGLKFEMGFCRWRVLKKDAVPSVYKQDAEYVEGVETTQRQEYKNIVDKLLREYEDGENHAPNSLEVPPNVQPTSYNGKTESLINEALFDNEENSKQENTSTGANDNRAFSLRSPIDIKSELDSVSTSDEIHHLNTQSFFDSFLSKCIQTDEAAEDRINCGFVNVSKCGTDKYFNLRCFYCDAEYPISFWSEFSDHILYNHGHLEQVFNKSDELESTTSEHSVIHDDVESTQTALEEEIEPINYINLDDMGESGTTNCITLDDHLADLEPEVSSKKKKKEEKLKNKLMKTLSKNSNTFDAAEFYMHEDNYVPTVDHSYSQTVLNKTTNHIPLKDAAQSIDEIDFDKTPRYIMLDFLDNLKGLPSLWRERELDYEQFDVDLINLMEVMRLKWELNLSISSLYKNLESIKAWFNGIRDSKENSGNSNVQHLFGEYYEKCLELVIFENATKTDLLRCDLCNRYNANIAKLQAHKFLKHGLGQLPYGCNKCDKRFIYIERFISHIKNHKRKTEKQRKRVEKLIATASRRKKEQSSESATKQVLYCFQCNKKFSYEKEYRLHLDVHPKGDCPYGCRECDARYKTLLSLKSHKKTLHTSKVHQCNICQLITTTLQGLKRHMEGHTGICNYVCELCGKQFVRRKNWTEHCLFEHTGHGKCKICNRVYKRHSVLRKHLRTLHRPIFGTNEELSKPFEREGRCGSLVKRKPRILKNPRKSQEKRGENLKLRKYEYIIDPVTKKRRLKCPKCDETFCTYNSVRRHALKKHNYDCRKIEREEDKYKYFSNRRVKIVDSSPIYGNSDDLKDYIEEEKSIIASPECGFEKLDYKSDDGGSDDNNVLLTNEIDDDKTIIEISFEKYVDEISIDSNYSIQSANDLEDSEGDSPKKFDTSISKLEEFECDSYIAQSYDYNDFD